MNKIYSICTLLLASVTSLAGSAESRTVKIHVDEPSRVTEIKCGDYGVDQKYSLDEDGCFEVTFGNEEGTVKKVNIYVIPDAEIVDMTYQDGTSPKFEGAYAWSKPVDNRKSYVYFTGYDTYSGFGVEEGADLYLSTKALPSKKLTFTGNQEQMTIQVLNMSTYTYDDVEPDEEGVWEINGNGVSDFRVSAKEDYLISSITYDDGDESGELSSSTMVRNKSIFSRDFTGDTAFTVVTIAEEDARTASITLRLAEGADVALLRNGKDVVLTEEAEQTVKFNPLNDEKYFKVTRKSDPTRKLYEVIYTPAAEGDEAPAPQKNNGVASYSFTATDGGLLEVNSEFPDVTVPVHFTFVNEGTEASITSVKVNGVAVEDGAWMADGFSVKLSDKIELVQDKENYEFKDKWISVNGVASSDPAFEVLDENVEGGYKVEITSRKFVMRKIAIMAPAYEYLNVNVVTTPNPSQWWNSIETPVEFDEKGFAEVEVAESNVTIKFATKTGLYKYVDRSVVDYATDEVLDLSYGVSSGNVENDKLYDGMTLYCKVEKKRPSEVLVYLEDADWTGADITLDPASPFEQSVSLTADEYTKVAFAESNDLVTDDFTAATFSSLVSEGEAPVFYLNDVKLEADGDAALSFADMKSGDVLKVYVEEKEPFTVTYDIHQDLNVSVTHDFVNAIETPASHQVLPGTMIHITPVATLAEEDPETTKASVIVTCNGANVEANEDGVFAVKVTKDSDIKVSNSTVVGISNIIGDEDSAVEVYDLNGRRVAETTKGLVIRGGKVEIRR